MDCFERLTDYDFRHLVRDQARDRPEFVHVIFALNDDGTNAWYTARNRRNELAGYVRDLEQARALCHQASDNASTVGLQVRYALISASLEEIARKIPPELLKRLLQSNAFSLEQVTAWAKLNSRPERHLEILRVASGHDTTAVYLEFWLEALATGARIRDADNKVLGVVRLAPGLPGYLQKKVIELLVAEQNEGSRSGALRTLAGLDGVDTEALQHAWQAALDIRSAALRREAILALAPRLGEPQQRDALAAGIADWEADPERPLQPSHRSGRTLTSDLTTIVELMARYPAERLKEAKRGASSHASRLLLCAAMCEQRVASDPSTVWSLVCDQSLSVTERVWRHLALAHARRSEWEPSMFCFGQIGRLFSGERETALASLLATGIVSPFRGVFGDLAESAKLKVLQLVAGDSKAPDALLRQLAADVPDRRLAILLRAKIARALSDKEIRLLLSEADGDSWLLSHVVGDVAERLALEEATGYLARRDLHFSTDMRHALLRRLIRLGAFDVVVATTGAGSALDAKADIELLVGLYPADRLRALLQLVRPHLCLEQMADLRSAMSNSLAEGRFEQFIAEAAKLPAVADRLDVLSRLASGSSDTRQQAHISTLLASGLKVFIGADDTAGSFQIVRRALGALSRLEPGPSALDWREICAAIRSSYKEIETQIGLLGILIEDHASTTGCRLALEACFAIVIEHDSEQVFRQIGNLIGPKHGPVLGGFVESIDQRALAFFARLTGGYLDRPSIEHLLRRCTSLADNVQRLVAYRSLLARAGRELAHGVVERELAAVSEAAPGDWRFMWLTVLASCSPAYPTPTSIRAEFASLPIESRLEMALFAQTVQGEYLWMIGDATEKIDRFDARIQRRFFIRASRQLSLEQIEDAVRLPGWDTEDDGDLFRMAAAAQEKGSFHTALAYAHAGRDGHDAARLLAPLIPFLSASNLVSFVAYATAGTESRYPDTPVLTRLAKRAAELGDAELTSIFLAARKNNMHSDDIDVDEIFDGVCREKAAEFIAVALSLDGWERILAVVALLGKADDDEANRLTAALTTADDDDCASAIRHLRVAARPILAKLPPRCLKDLFARCLSDACREGRAVVLETVEVFLPSLRAIHGDDVCTEVDAGCAVGMANFEP